MTQTQHEIPGVDIPAARIKVGMAILWGHRWHRVNGAQAWGPSDRDLDSMKLWLGDMDSMVIADDMIVRVRPGYWPGLITDCAPYQADPSDGTCDWPSLGTAADDDRDALAAISDLADDELDQAADYPVYDGTLYPIDSDFEVTGNGTDHVHVVSQPPMWIGNLDSTDQ